MARFGGVAGTAFLLATAALAADSDQLNSAGVATVDSVVDPETLRLTDGRMVRLAGIEVPRQGFDFDRRWATQAVELLDQLVKGRQVELQQDERKFDRYGRVLAQVRRVAGDGETDVWLQGALLARGLARVLSLPGNMAKTAEMFGIEEAARAAALGLWSDPDYRIRTPDDLEGAVDRFQVVEGAVVDASYIGGRGYLNFGADYKTDFTVTFEASVRTMFEQAGIDPLAMKGRRIRVRGWLEFFNGPMIEISHPGQIEVVE